MEILTNIEDKIQPLFYKRHTGVYLLYKMGELIYVGVANDIYNRLTQHRISREAWDEVKYIEELDYYNAIQIENYFIDTYKPKLNKSMSKLKHHESIQRKRGSYLKRTYPSGWK